MTRLYNSGFPGSTDNVGFPFFLLGVGGWLLWVLVVGIVAVAFGIRTRIAKVGYTVTGLMLIVAIVTAIIGSL